MSPEQLTRRLVSIESDVYSFGVLVGECIERRLPFEEVARVEAAQLIVDDLRSVARASRRLSVRAADSKARRA